MGCGGIGNDAPLLFYAMAGPVVLRLAPSMRQPNDLRAGCASHPSEAGGGGPTQSPQGTVHREDALAGSLVGSSPAGSGRTTLDSQYSMICRAVS